MPGLPLAQPSAPLALFQTFRSRAVGVDMPACEPGFYIHGVIVDNPSGSWVRITPTLQYVPPYTYAWSAPLGGVRVVGLEYVAGPTNQASTLAGNPATLYLSEAPQASSSGSAFILQQSQAAFILQAHTAAAIVTNIVPWITLPIATSKFRILYIAARHNADSSLNITLTEMLGGTTFGNLTTTPENGYKDIIYPAGLDLPVGANIALSYQCLWGKMTFEVSLQYVII